MIEFIIPLNLPVRAVVATESASPPDWLQLEMTRWAIAEDQRVSRGQRTVEPVADDSTAEPLPAALPAETQQELDLLRGQRVLFTDSIEELRRATKLFEKRLEGLIQEFQVSAVELAHAITAKLIFEAVDDDRFPIDNLIHEVLTRLDTTVPTTIRLHPDDLAYVQQFPAIIDSNNEQSLQFVADSTLARGDCKAKAGEISVVYELKRQVEEIRRQLLSTVTGHAET